MSAQSLRRTHMANLSVAYIISFMRIITISLSSFGSSVYLQNRFCQSYWCIMHWHQWAYFHFNNTEIIVVFNVTFHRSLWQNESGMEMIKQPFVSGHVSSVCLSGPLQRGWVNERALWLEGISPKQRQITHFSCSSLSTMETCQNPTSVTVSQGSLQIQRWTGASCLVTCYLYHVLLFCVKSLTAFFLNAGLDLNMP